MHPRILIISQNWDYTNPTRRLIHEELARRYGAILSGWDYRENPNDVKFRYGAVDAVIADPWALSDSVSHHYTHIKPSNIRSYNAPVFLNLLTYDLHNLDDAFFSKIVDKCDYVLNACTSGQFLTTNYGYALEGEPWLDPSSAMIRMPALIDDRFILVPHAIAKDEFCYRSFMKRKFDVSILGASYRFRRDARLLVSEMKDIRYVCGMGRTQSLLGKLSNHYLFGPRFGITEVYRRRFRRVLAHSRLSVTCDGSIGYPVRKFFEIPASGAVLAGSFFPNAEDLGFVNGENCLFVDRFDFEALHSMVLEARGGSSRMSSLAAAGRDMVREYHTIEKRAAQIVELVTAVINSGRITTSWRGGVLKISTNT